MRVPWLGDVLRAAGLTVIDHGNPRGRGRDMNAVRAVILHDTVTRPSWSDTAVADLLRNGHSTLPGPLSQLGLDRQGRFWWIADGRCNHNGHGRYGNDTVGIETFANGGALPQEPWNDVQREAAARATAAILARVGLDVSRCLGHKESDPGRKQDPFGVSMPTVRRRVAELSTAPTPPPAEEDIVASIEELRQVIRDEAAHVAATVWQRPVVKDGLRADMALNRAATHSVAAGKTLAELLGRPAGEADATAIAAAVEAQGSDIARRVVDELVRRLA